MAVVKADAYGHGATPVVEALAAADPRAWFGVATPDEAATVRGSAPQARVCLLAPCLPEDAESVVECGATPVLSDRACVVACAEAARRRPTRLPVHVEVDTGMGRGGVTPDDLPALVRQIRDEPALELEGLMTHFPEAESNAALTLAQVSTLEASYRAIVGRDEALLLHAANSAALILHPASRLDMARPGMALYGLLPLLPIGADAPDLEPALSLYARVLLVRNLAAGHTVSYGRTHALTRQSRIAVLGIGYADGYPRALSNCGAALIRGCRAPVVGRVCMDVTMVDVTDIPEAQAGDVALLIGRSGEHEIRADDLARSIGATEHEITTCLGRRIPRVVSSVC